MHNAEAVCKARADPLLYNAHAHARHKKAKRKV
jgi:hypothetical protein